MSSEPERPGVIGDPRHVAGAVAWIDLRPCRHAPGAAAARGVVLALRQLGRAVRADDRVCPVGGASVAVRFGPVASAVPLEVLGDRLARSVGPSLPLGGPGPDWTVAVGVASPGVDDDDDRVSARARSAAGGSARSLAGERARPAPVATVTVDEPTDIVSLKAAGAGTPVALRRRAVRRYGTRRVDGIPTLEAVDRSLRARRGADQARASALCVLVVDPAGGDRGGPGLAAATAATVAERVGCRVGTAAVPPEGPLITTVDGVDVDLVVLVLDGARVGSSANWADGSWGLPARLTTAYVDKGLPVLAVGAGAGAGPLASCVAHGSLALFDLDRLADALLSLDGFPLDEARQVSELGFPPRFRSLLALTAGERRVLFYLTEGWAAQEIADELVVSLTTVRSHIRSVLRKLEVRSQLAAVAVANSRDLEHHPVLTHP